ncbi:hypothetical protein HAX54_004648 [Datura stramonium]|uniref:Uncharacterized protein n=1 Tax=Datura stramonium TaxID=4076 RepID=A0ABS8T9P4_DATST|nr:hypothetical protein [Datura stramonium]
MGMTRSSVVGDEASILVVRALASSLKLEIDYKDEAYHPEEIGTIQAPHDFVATSILRDIIVRGLSFPEGISHLRSAAFVTPHIVVAPFTNLAPYLVASPIISAKERKMFDYFVQMVIFISL